MFHGSTSKAFNYIYIKQDKYNKLAPTGEADFSVYAAESSQSGLENWGEVLTVKAEALLGQRQILLKWEEMEISLSRLRAQFILPFPPLSGRHLECFRQSIREILPRSPSWGTLKVCPGKRLCLTSGMMFVVMEIETGTVVCRNLLNTSTAWLLIAVFFFVCFFSTLFFLL